jgi:hypothetical protein
MKFKVDFSSNKIDFSSNKIDFSSNKIDFLSKGGGGAEKLMTHRACNCLCSTSKSWMYVGVFSQTPRQLIEPWKLCRGPLNAISNPPGRRFHFAGIELASIKVDGMSRVWVWFFSALMWTTKIMLLLLCTEVQTSDFEMYVCNSMYVYFNFWKLEYSILYSTYVCTACTAQGLVRMPKFRNIDMGMPMYVTGR